MDLRQQDRLLLAALRHGLPAVPRPYEAIGRDCGMTESAVIARLETLLDSGVVRRLGLVVHHRALGYDANAMVVWDVPDDQVDTIGRRMADWPAVTLCYQRPRRLPRWPYNLFCMIHGRERARVSAEVERLAAALGLDPARHAVLFSRHCFKQRGAWFGPGPDEMEEPWTPSTAVS
jgi:DNA-binding Lrp family transcriptional regulator